jgi:hypothetical protein
MCALGFALGGEPGARVAERLAMRGRAEGLAESGLLMSDAARRIERGPPKRG